MIHNKFNLFFAVAAKQFMEYVLTCNVKHILISFAYKEPWQMKELLKRNNVDILLDSGAFTAWNQAQKKKQEGNTNWEKYLIDIDEYAAFMEEHKDIIWRAVNLDVIPGEQGKEPTKEQYIESAEQGWKNYLYLKEKGFNTIHVFHQGEPLKYLTQMIDGGCDYIGISPNNDYSDKKKMLWLDRAFRHIKNSSNPAIKTHGFGVTSNALIDRYPWFSCDSAAYCLSAALGTVATPYGKVNTSDRDTTDAKHIEQKPAMVQKHIDDYLKKEIGYGLGSMTKTVEEHKFACSNCDYEITTPIKIQAYKARNFANIVHLMNKEKEIQDNPEPNMRFDAQKTLL